MIELKALQSQVRRLVDDLRTQVPVTVGLLPKLEKEYGEAKAAKRVGGTFETWLEDVLDQAAVAWVLGCIFVRFCEDNELVNGLWLGGPEPHASVEYAYQRRQAFLTGTTHNDRHWLREAFGYLKSLRVAEKIFDDHNPVWRFEPSADAAEALADFFRKGAGRVSLREPQLDTRFLGDLYEDLSEHARKTYALCQTPIFIQEFVLDRTLVPALQEFGLAETKVIDPACGSGHFLLGAFHRLSMLWQQREPGSDARERTQRALDQVTGVDINPVAVAIARFRLLIAALKACGISSLERAPAFAVRVATGDSLLQWHTDGRGKQGDLLALAQQRSAFAYVTEDAQQLAEYLKPGQYTVVVGNPPYITVRDKALNELYRGLYNACSGKYALTVPFAQRFFELARPGDHDGRGSGWVGQITSNSFTKREFGKKLIEEFFAKQVELSEVIDSSGAYIPGHGTPTVIMIGRNNLWKRASTLRTILGVRGEPGAPDDPATGLVWRAIIDQIDAPGSESVWVTSADFPRGQLATHPWSLSGGGASDLMEVLEDCPTELGTTVSRVGVFGMTNADDVMLADAAAWARRAGDLSLNRRLALGDELRDWICSDGAWSFFPYDDELKLLKLTEGGHYRWLWPSRTVMGNRVTFGKQTYFEEGRPWYGWHQVTRDPGTHEWWIAFAEVATHNHFVLDRGGKVFKQTAPVIKLSEEASEDDHLALLGMLNSSTANFWLKQVCFSKGGSGMGRGIQPEDWMERYAFNASNVQEFPLPEGRPLDWGRALDALAHQLAKSIPLAVAATGVPTRTRLAEARAAWESCRALMIAAQEELDWEVYRLYGLLDDTLTIEYPPEISLGERAFEIVLARRVAAGELETQWFERHGSSPIAEIPNHWPADYRQLVQRRIDLIEADRNIALLEKPEHKRRWATDGWDAMQSAALRDWLLDRLEATTIWGATPVPLSVAQIADRVAHDEDFRHVLELWLGSNAYDLTKALTKLLADEWVPFLPVDRYKPSGLRKRAQWERTWELQRLEDDGEPVVIDVPPKYGSGDFAKPSYWRARGKLDVPKERFIAYPRMGRDGDGSELLGWAGWDHLAQAQALATVYLDRRTQAAWPADRLLPLLAGLAELEPWLHQWHAEPKAGFPGTPADFFTTFIDTELSTLDADRAALTRLRGLELP
ncbi:BREX-2 system adenine-specific DNA-methyltransferase PglX [Catellatospora sp. NPDC049111]|uniref:BREX-2 system adenine-specific DNA-methyltransferase PglX n=1 Tax=Catellatospora sp. NPDC049111 TaxID=3155271 RepID=UPI0033D6C178